MRSIIITKWIEPYKLLETIKQNYSYKDYTFDTITKNMKKKSFLKELSLNKFSIGLFMKNVNKYYLFSRDSEFDIMSELQKDFQLNPSDYTESISENQPFEMVDLGQAEASLIFN